MKKPHLPNRALQIVIAICALLITLILIYWTCCPMSKNSTQLSAVSNKPNHNSLDYNREYEKLARLSAEVQIDYFTNLLGGAIYINPSSTGLDEYIFVHPLYYVQALVQNNTGKVMAYGVTARTEDFYPPLIIGADRQIAIGEKSFTDLATEITDGNQPDSCYYNLGNTATSYFFESFYFGNPGYYQTYLIGINSSAIYKNGQFPDTDNRLNPTCADMKAESLSASYPNSYLVLNADMSIEDYPFDEFSLGPNAVQVRTLHE